MAKVIYPSGYEQEQVPSLCLRGSGYSCKRQAAPQKFCLPWGPCWACIWSQNSMEFSLGCSLSGPLRASVSVFTLKNGESLGRNRVVSSTQCSGLGKDTRCGGCPTGRKPAKEMGGAGAGSGRQLQGHTEVAQSEGPALKLVQPSTIPALPLQHLCPVSPSVNAHLDCACHRSRDQDQPAPTIPPRPVCSFERLQ